MGYAENRIAILLGSSIAFGILYITGVVIYRLWFHPLAKYPGPFLNRVSQIPAIYAVIVGRLPMHTKTIHDKYGPIVRLSPNELSFNTPEAWEDIYGLRPGRPNLSKDPIHVGSVDPVPGVSTISMADNETHARQRRALSHGFSQQALWGQEEIVQSFVTKLLDNVEAFAQEKKSFNIVDWFNFMTFDVIGDLAFGESFGCLDKGDFHFWITLIFRAVQAGAVETATRRVATPGSPLQQYLMKWIPNEMRKQRKDHLAYSREKVLKRLADTKTDRKDFVHYIVRQSKKIDLSQDEIIVNGALFIVAGSETTAMTLSATVNFMMAHPAKFAKLREEIRSTYAREEEITVDKATNLQYLNACVEETLRLLPPAPIGFLRSVPQGGDTIDGQYLPGGTTVSVSTWCAAHSPDNFQNPDEFIPERWYDPKYANDKRLASRPFSMGPRGCIGKNLAYMELRLALSRLFWRYNVESVDGAPDWTTEGQMKNMKAYSTWVKPELNVRVLPAVQ
ncbi:averantin oxidoreductase [Paraphaeosphaeria sporulosa]|uniref:Averantin oxidoreductase n=1 Tax=Paraphaeosphaeria sporulosa TaxID=1460663 RepID=A0A177CJ71_9PLEO|nr:averantin oxidoreductase [Paraphaeosphaeria sporulosa]OAG06908.1 averantin oxidoreductase [Paraphaeosphaeria sporulosa]